MKALAGARVLVEQAGLPMHLHVGVGDAGEIALGFARRLDCQQIVMGMRGLGSVAGMLMGSVARHVVAGSDVPVTLVRRAACLRTRDRARRRTAVIASEAKQSPSYCALRWRLPRMPSGLTLGLTRGSLRSSQ